MIGGLLAISSTAAASPTPPVTGHLTYVDTFTVQPGDPASCSFPISAVQNVKAAYQVFFDAQGNATRVMVHAEWIGTSSANGKTVYEHASQHETFTLVTGTATTTGQIHDQSPYGGVLIHDVGILRFDANGNPTFEAGPHNGFDGDTAAIQRLCNALT